MIGSLSQWDHMTDTSEAPNGVVLREVSEQDVQTFYENQLDSEAIRIASVPRQRSGDPLFPLAKDLDG